MKGKIETWGLALLARIFNFFIPIEKKHWIFGSDLGRTYRDGPKYLLEYMIKEHPEITCTFITQNRDLYKELNAQGIPCKLNGSISGIITICKAECEFFTHSVYDILYAYSKKGRHHYYLIHGQPYKKAVKSLSKEYRERVLIDSDSKLSIFKELIGKWLLTGRTIFDTDFVSATSDFLVPYLRKDNGDEIDVKVLGMPRNDALFQNRRMEKERWVKGIEGKFVVLYMPTHRGYGTGEPSPTPFINDLDVQSWMRDNNVILLMKNHPNMIPCIKDDINTDVIIDITKLNLDPQVCIYKSDVLITDYSSVWMDYLILQRPLIFYTYDNWEENDAGVYYDIRKDPPGHFCSTEEDLFKLIKKAKFDYDEMRPTAHILEKYHKYVDGNSCERYYSEISKSLYGKR